MKETATFMELIAGAGITITSLIGALIAAWVAINNKISKMETDIEYIKKEQTSEKKDNKEALEGLKEQMHQMYQLMVDIKVEMQNKQNR